MIVKIKFMDYFWKVSILYHVKKKIEFDYTYYFEITKHIFSLSYEKHEMYYKIIKLKICMNILSFTSINY